MERTLAERSGAVIAFIFVIIINFLSNYLPLNGMTPKDVSDKYPSLFTPESFTFSIWGVIYLGLLGYVIYQALPGQRRSELLSRVSKLFMLSCAANIAWIFAWHFNFLWLSLLIMFAILGFLVLIYRNLSYEPATFGRWLFVNVPFSLYVAWIVVASIANLSVLQVAMGWENYGLDNLSWTLLKLALAGVVTAVVVTRRSDIAFGLVTAWAAYGIMVKQVATPEVSGAAGMLAAMVIILVAYQGIRAVMFSPVPPTE
ncbi:tryptophan-rich sensory protein [Leucothrix mucor]|uniref:tryptophan-rich sensory protein n=1 Tax=Leucothrix mucor TaxID=45248 RepID=UPI0003B744CF|nr:tryptophan-rich sensory protein [Leucothrix mucor]